MDECENEQKPCEECNKECHWWNKNLREWIDELWHTETYGKSLGG